MNLKSAYVDRDEIIFALFKLVLIGLLLVASFLVFTGITADHRPRLFYISNTESGAPMHCVYIYREWWPDSRSFCSSDIDKAVSVMNQLNLQLKTDSLQLKDTK